MDRPSPRLIFQQTTARRQGVKVGKRQMKTETMTDDHGHECAEVRKLPTGGGGNILCGRAAYEKEMRFRRERIKAGAPFDLPTWESLEVYFPEGRT